MTIRRAETASIISVHGNYRVFRVLGIAKVQQTGTSFEELHIDNIHRVRAFGLIEEKSFNVTYIYRSPICCGQRLFSQGLFGTLQATTVIPVICLSRKLRPDFQHPQLWSHAEELNHLTRTTSHRAHIHVYISSSSNTMPSDCCSPKRQLR